MRKEFRDLAPPAEARELIDAFDLGGVETVPLEDARGRVLAERVDAAIDVPGFDRSNVDGYAVRAQDTFGADEMTPAELQIAGTVHAGETPTVSVDEAQAVEIATGGVVPPGADAVVMVERTERDDDVVSVRTAVAPGEGIMVAGTDIAAGERALGPGTRLTPREIGLLSALGTEAVPVRRTPQVGIISTGDELVYPGETLDSDAGEIYDVNSYTIGAGVEEAGGEPVYYPLVGDDYDTMRDVLMQAADECDLVLSSGSTSAGAADHIYQIIEEYGELHCHGVAVKPGKPMLIGQLNETPYVGLPGFPVSALTIFQTFVAPSLRGTKQAERRSVTGTMAQTERYKEGRTRFMPVGLVEDGDGELLVYPVDKGSGATTSLVEADGTVKLQPDTEQLDAGETVEVEPFSADVKTPELLAVGEDDPLFSRLLDSFDRPRYLSPGSREGLRRLRNGIPDVAIVAGPTEREVDSVTLGAWTREWGLVVPADNPNDVTGLADIVTSDLQFVNRPRSSGLRQSLEAALTALAEQRSEQLESVTDAVRGFEFTASAFESPARRVREGKADVGLGLATTAAMLEMGFVSLGQQRVEIRAAPSRTNKPAVETLADMFPLASEVFDELDGFDSA